MKQFVQSEVSHRFVQLPEHVQDVGLSEAVGNAIGRAISDLGVNRELASQCNEQITMVLVGLSTAEDLATYFQKDLGLDEMRISACMTTLRNGVFSPMRTALMKVVSTQPQPSVPTPTVMNPNLAIATPPTSIDPYQEHTT